MPRLRHLRALILPLAVVALSACGSSAKPRHNTAPTAAPQRFQGIVLTPPKTAPGLALRDYTGQPVSLASLRGHAVFLTFIYTHCPDVCPLIAAGLAAVQRDLGALANRVRIVAVTVDPKGDTPKAVRLFLAARGAVGRMYYLIGSHRQLLPIWHAYGIATNVNGNSVRNGHTSIVFGITPEGKVVVVYPANFTPGEIVHDVPLLLRS
jgi:protein SCO1/2